MDTADKWLLYIMGPRKMQNELLASFLEKETGLSCLSGSFDGFSAQEVETTGEIILFCDCLDKDHSEMLALMTAKFQAQSSLYPVFYNVSEKIDVGDELISAGIWGLFYDNEPPKNLVYGIKAIQKGEIWLPRQLLSSCLLTLRRRENIDEPEEQDLLSFREREVLQMITIGSTNDKIADDLCISPHTVRSHIYRIFRKIEVTNRQQAAAWAAKHIPDN
ncbi:MAG: response regulator transcription factor [Pseudomonadota bacterium]|nr:response regulator transcription factor [Pseudomonadota bacterium]